MNPAMTHDSNLLDVAHAFAYGAHAGIDQRRKYTNEPYINHPAAVARTLAEHGFPEFVVAAGFLHDVVEDTKVTLDVIEHIFGSRIADLVMWVTDVSKPADGNRAARKDKDREHIAKAPAIAKSIKLADLIDNTFTIVTHDPEFATVYMREKRDLLTVLEDGHPQLYQRAKTQVELYFAGEY